MREGAAGAGARCRSAERALVASCRAESPDSLAGHAGEEARADLVVAPLLLHPSPCSDICCPAMLQRRFHQAQMQSLAKSQA